MTQSDEIVVDEEKAISELRKRMKNELPTFIYEDTLALHNFLKARNYNLDQAEGMLRKHIEFRKVLQVDTLVRDYKAPEVLKKYLPQSLIGFDKEGCLIRYCPMGNLDGRGIFKCANAGDVLRTCIQSIQSDAETLKRIAKKTGKPVSKCVFIYNLENMTLAKATHKRSIEYYLQGLGIFVDNYPEILKSVYIINASIYFTMVFSLVQRMLSGALLKKIHVYGQDGWKEHLLEGISEDVLPAFLGGTRTDPDGNPFCNTFIEHAGMIPEKFYLKKNPQNLLKEPGCQVANVHAHADLQIPIYVDSPKSVIEWEYECTKSDISFSLLYKESKESKPVELIPLHKVDQSVGPERGMYRCDKSGSYIFVFDNSNSWFNAKQIYYVINVVKAKEYIEDCI